MSLELIQQRLEELSANLESLNASVENVARRARDAESTALSVESQVDDNLGEIQYLRDRTTQAEERVRDALLDIQGVNLEQRINEAILAKVQDGTITAVEVERAPTTLQVADSRIWEQPIQFDVITPSSPFPVATGGTYPVVQSESNDLSASEAEDVADYLTSGIVLPDDGAGPSETASPNEVEDEF